MVIQLLKANFAINFGDANFRFGEPPINSDPNEDDSPFEYQVYRTSNEQVMIDVFGSILKLRYEFDPSNTLQFETISGINLIKVRNADAPGNTITIVFPEADTIIQFNRNNFYVDGDVNGDVHILNGTKEQGSNHISIIGGKFIQWWVTPDLNDPAQWTIINGTKIITLI